MENDDNEYQNDDRELPSGDRGLEFFILAILLGFCIALPLLAFFGKE